MYIKLVVDTCIIITLAVIIQKYELFTSSAYLHEYGYNFKMGKNHYSDSLNLKRSCTVFFKLLLLTLFTF